MPWTEFCTLVSGLMNDTPLGQIVAIRSEKDPKVIKNFTAGQRRIRTDWITKQAKRKSPQVIQRELDDLQRSFAIMFGKGGENK